MYLLSYIDRTKFVFSCLFNRYLARLTSPGQFRSVGNAKIAGMSDDIGLDSAQYSAILVVLFGRVSPCTTLFYMKIHR